MRRAFLTLTVLLSLLSVSGFIPFQQSNTLAILNRAGQPTVQITDGDKIKTKAKEKRHTQCIHKEYIKLTGRLHGILNNAHLYQAGNQTAEDKSPDGAFGSRLKTAVEVNHYNRGYNQEVQQVNTDR